MTVWQIIPTERCFPSNKAWITSDLKKLQNIKNKSLWGEFRNEKGPRLKVKGTHTSIIRTLPPVKPPHTLHNEMLDIRIQYATLLKPVGLSCTCETRHFITFLSKYLDQFTLLNIHVPFRLTGTTDESQTCPAAIYKWKISNLFRQDRLPVM